jgi:DNA-binding transcriptional MerR regulator
MPLSRTRDYLSIGEVLDSVREEFPDVSISKIRFLESEGLIAPERTPSGYRKFYDADISRLRYILSLQRDHFMPLRVIRERLKQSDANGGVPDVPAPTPATPAAAENGASKEQLGSGVSLTREELAKAAGLTDDQLRGLEDFGVLPPREDDRYDESDLLLASSARRIMSYGAEPRHLRMFRQFAEREVAFFEQMVMPARRRDPDAHKAALQSINELVDVARKMHDSLLRTSVRDLL